MKRVFFFFFLVFWYSFAGIYEVNSKYYKVDVFPRGGDVSGVTLGRGKFFGGFKPPNPCGISAGLNFFYGIKTSLQALEEFLLDWKSSATALLLYALATSFPVAKEALLGANTLSNFLARLRGFSCTRVMQAIREFNYTDSFLIKKCIARRLGIDESDVEALKTTDPQEWYRAYRACLDSANIVDLLGPEARPYLKWISPKSQAKCILGVRDDWGWQEVVNADVSTKAKYFLYWVLPDLVLSGNGEVKIETHYMKDPETGEMKPVTLSELLRLYKEQFSKDFDELMKEVEESFTSGDPIANLEGLKGRIEEFGKKYGLKTEDLEALVEAVGILYKVWKKRADEGKVNVYTLSKKDEVLSIMRSDLKNYLMKKALASLSMQIEQQALSLNEAFQTRKVVGSQQGQCGS